MRNLIDKYFLRRRVIFIVALLMIGGIASIAYNYKNTGVFKVVNKKLPIYSVETKEKKVAISFDVSSGGIDNIDKLLDILDKYNVKATFFLVGYYVDDNPEKIKEIKKRGHEIGNHSNKHPDMTKITKERIIQEIAICDAKIMSLTGEGTNLFRFPAGEYNDASIETVESTNHYAVQWDADSIDWKENGADIEYNRVIKKTRPGSIMLFHNNAKYTPENLPKIIEKLKGEGYSFIKVSELIYNDNYYLDSTGRQIKK